MTLTIKLDRNWSSFQLANSAPPLSVTDSAIAPSARMLVAGAEGAARHVSMTTVCFTGCVLSMECAAPHIGECDRGVNHLLGPEGPSKIEEVTLMRPIHGNL